MVYVVEGVVRVVGVGWDVVVEVCFVYLGVVVDDEGELVDLGLEDGVVDGLDVWWEGEDCGLDLVDDFEVYVGLVGVVVDWEEDLFGDCLVCYEGGGEYV